MDPGSRKRHKREQDEEDDPHDSFFERNAHSADGLRVISTFFSLDRVCEIEERERDIERREDELDERARELELMYDWVNRLSRLARKKVKISVG